MSVYLSGYATRTSKYGVLGIQDDDTTSCYITPIVQSTGACFWCQVPG